jgi:lysophospholipase L1-like esterase
MKKDVVEPTGIVRMSRLLPDGGTVFRILWRVWLLVGLTLLVVLVAEATVRILYLVRDSDKSPYGLSEWAPQWTSEVYASSAWIGKYADEADRSLVFEWYPYVQWRAAPFAGKLINIGPGGIRRTWNSSDCDADPTVTRVFMFGGSTMWGFGARDDFTIPSLVARKLVTQGYRHVCVVNFAERAYVTTQEVLTLLLQLRAGNTPSVVVFYDGVNDILAAYQSGAAGTPLNEHNRQAEFNLTKRGGEMFARGTRVAVKTSSLYRFWSSTWKGLLDARAEARSDRRELDEGQRISLADSILRTYAANTDIVRTLAREYGFKTLFYWQPVAFVSKQLTADEKQRVETHERSRHFEEIFKTTYKRLAAHESLVGASGFRDLSGVFRAVTASVFIDFAHKSENGNERVAEEIVRDVMMVLDAGAAGARKRVTNGTRRGGV